MGNQNSGAGARRDRNDSSSASRHVRTFTGDDECPVQVKIPKNEGEDGSTAALQYMNATEFPVVLKWSKATPNTKNVYISGSWDQWKKKIPLVRSHDDFTTILNLPEGKHEFKYNVDGQWCVDPAQKKTDNPVGGQNNVVDIEKKDFEVFEALDRDLTETVNSAEASGKPPDPSATVLERDLGKHKPYTQEIPDRRDFDQAHHPPILPPHLLQVILNKDTPVSCDPNVLPEPNHVMLNHLYALSIKVILNKDTPVSCDPNVLPEPNHVMLNHLYALSIKDGVMVLSATHRFRKKYVTTLLYRPIAN